jgi:hypothetical protein
MEAFNSIMKGTVSMNRTFTFTGTLVFLCVGIAVAQPPMKGHEGNRMPAVAPFGPPGAGGGGENNPPMILDVVELQTLLTEIGISKPVIDKAVTIVRSSLTEFEGKLIKVQREELGIREELLKEKPDLKVIQNCISRKSQVFAEIEFSQIKRDIEIKALLTPDEYDRWKAATKKRMKEMMPSRMCKEQPDGDPAPAQPKQHK